MISRVHVTIETGNGNDLQNFTNLFNGSNGKSSSPPPQPQPSSESGPSSSALFLSSIIALSSLAVGSTVTPFMSQLYQDATCLPKSITPVYVGMLFPSSTVPPVFKIPLYIPLFTSISSHAPEKTSTSFFFITKAYFFASFIY